MKKKKYLTLKEIQKEELEMLRVLVDFLKKHNLNYYIWAGTFLGAVRHNGFIPWDDDIDLAMIRPEYNKFLDVLKSVDCKISDDIYAECFELNNSNFPFLKIVNKNIEIDEDEKFDKYLWIDIFPLDATPKENLKYYERIMFFRKFLILGMTDYKYLKKITSPIKMFFKNIVLFVLKFIKINTVIDKYIKLCTKYSYDEYDYVHNNVWGSTPTVILKKELEDAEYKFEDLKLNGIKDYDFFLNRAYGNYMELPAKELRENHGFKAWRVK